MEPGLLPREEPVELAIRRANLDFGTPARSLLVSTMLLWRPFHPGFDRHHTPRIEMHGYGLAHCTPLVVVNEPT